MNHLDIEVEVVLNSRMLKKRNLMKGRRSLCIWLLVPLQAQCQVGLGSTHFEKMSFSKRMLNSWNKLWIQEDQEETTSKIWVSVQTWVLVVCPDKVGRHLVQLHQFSRKSHPIYEVFQVLLLLKEFLLQIIVPSTQTTRIREQK